MGVYYWAKIRRIIRYIQIRPVLDFWEVKYIYESSSPLAEIRIVSDRLHGLVSRLVSLAYPTREDKYDKWWVFYLPLRRECWVFREAILVPVHILNYRDRYFLVMQSIGTVSIIRMGDPEVEFMDRIGLAYVKTGKFVDMTERIIREMYRFCAFIMENPRIVEVLVPYDIRTGKIKGKHVRRETLPEWLAEFVLEKYREHLSKNLRIEKVSLNEYLSVAAICYRAAFGEETKGLRPIDMYKKWSDMRHGGMLDIKDWDSKDEFYEWMYEKRDPGSHPFEIVFSFMEKGISLFPPSKWHDYYVLTCSTYLYADIYISMVLALIENEVPFKAPDLEEMLSYLTGEKIFTVNHGHPLTSLTFHEEREYFEKYFPYIKWDRLEIPKWRNI